MSQTKMRATDSYAYSHCSRWMSLEQRAQAWLPCSTSPVVVDYKQLGLVVQRERCVVVGPGVTRILVFSCHHPPLSHATAFLVPSSCGLFTNQPLPANCPGVAIQQTTNMSISSSLMIGQKRKNNKNHQQHYTIKLFVYCLFTHHVRLYMTYCHLHIAHKQFSFSNFNIQQ